MQPLSAPSLTSCHPRASPQLLLAPDDSDWGQGLSVAFDSGGGGHAVLLLRAGTFPTMLDQDFTFSAQEYVQGPQVLEPHQHMPSRLRFPGDLGLFWVYVF